MSWELGRKILVKESLFRDLVIVNCSIYYSNIIQFILFLEKIHIECSIKVFKKVRETKFLFYPTVIECCKCIFPTLGEEFHPPPHPNYVWKMLHWSRGRMATDQLCLLSVCDVHQESGMKRLWFWVLHYDRGSWNNWVLKEMAGVQLNNRLKICISVLPLPLKNFQPLVLSVPFHCYHF